MSECVCSPHPNPHRVFCQGCTPRLVFPCSTPTLKHTENEKKEGGSSVSTPDLQEFLFLNRSASLSSESKLEFNHNHTHTLGVTIFSISHLQQVVRVCSLLLHSSAFNHHPRIKLAVWHTTIFLILYHLTVPSHRARYSEPGVSAAGAKALLFLCNDPR